MIYKKREDLLIVDTDTIIESIEVSEIKKLLLKPNYNIYFENNNNNIYGVITIDDIYNAIDKKKSNITINKDFFFIKGKNYYTAKNYFNNNEIINEIPVIRNKKLLGAYIKGINFSCLKELYSFIDLYEDLNTKRIGFINSSNYYNKDKVNFLKDLFESNNAIFNIITYKEFFDGNEDYDYVLFETEAEWSNFKIIAKIFNKGFSFSRYQSLFSLYELFNDNLIVRVAVKHLSSFFEKIQQEGVNVFNVFMSYGNQYTLDLLDAIKDKYKKANVFFTENVVPDPKKFFCDLYTKEYAKEILGTRLNFRNVSGINYLVDYKSKYFNVSDGVRLTTDTIDNPISNIHMFGPCITIGTHVEDKNTIESFLQRKLNENGIKMNVINHGVWNNTLSQMELINETDIYKGDTIVFFQVFDYIHGIPNIDIIDLIKNENVPIDWFVDGVVHVNHKVNEIYANGIYDEMLPYLYEPEERYLIEKNYDITSKVYLDRYFKDMDFSYYNDVGCIIMNCNPLTKGHRYLVEEASKMVDFLIVFVVTEENALFDFNERFAIARDGLKDIPNTYVVPSWSVLTSRKTFPEYFSKSIDNRIDYNIQKHINYFVDYIVPFLNIKTRFVGTEPMDKITNKFNEIMERELPRKCVRLVEIERKKYEDRPISASIVRKLLEKNNTKDLKFYLQDSTIEKILEK